MTSPNHPLLRAWLPAVFWMGVIAMESTDWFSSAHTGRILYPFFHLLFRLSPDQFDVVHHYIRKAGHVFGYGMLSWLLFRAWRATLPMLDRRGRTLRWAGMAIGMTVIVASLDEWHQSFLPSRTGTPWDVLLDSVAGLAAQILVLLCLWPSRHQT